MGIRLPRTLSPALLHVLFATALVARGVVATPVLGRHVGSLSIAARDVSSVYDSSEPALAEFDVGTVKSRNETESVNGDRERVHDHIQGPFVAHENENTYEDKAVHGNDVLIQQENASVYAVTGEAHETPAVAIIPAATFAARRRDTEVEEAESSEDTEEVETNPPAAPSDAIEDLPADETQSDLDRVTVNDTTDWSDWTDEPPPLPVVTCHGALACPGDIAVVANGTSVAVCQTGKTLEQVVADAPDWSVILVGKDEHVSAEILLSKSLVFRGCKPDGGKAIITTDINADEGSIFRIGGRGQRLEFYDLSFERTGLGFASAIRTWERLETDTSDLIGSQAWLVIETCEFKNFYTRARGGAALFIDSMNDFSLRGSLFQGNRVNIVGERFDGGGAVWVLWVDDIRKMEVKDCYFADNHHEFQHGEGGALKIGNIMGKVDIIGNVFTSNSASGGGALVITGIAELATVTIDSKFENNFATEFGWGSRGGAAWLQQIDGTAIIRGEFVNNTAPYARAGAIANNGISMNASVTIEAYFGNNRCLEGGAAWDTLGAGFQSTAKFTLKSTCTFAGNTGELGRIIRLTRPHGAKAIFTREEDWNGNYDLEYNAQLSE